MKELPYFKFDSAEWISGNITLEDDEVQGLFINICAHYWFKSGKLKLTEIKRRLSKSKPTTFKSLIDNGHIKVKNDILTISFLDDQLHERGLLSERNSKNGALGGRPKKPTAFFSESDLKAKKSNIEKRREEERREEATESDFFFTKQEAFESIKLDELTIEETIRILTGRGWAAANGIDVMAALRQFLNGKAKLDQPKNEVKQHFKNWLFIEKLENLQTYSQVFKAAQNGR